MPKKKYAAIYSGGKDGHLAMLKMIQAGNDVSCLLNLDGGDRHSSFFHDLRKTEIIKLHAEKLNIPLVSVPVQPWFKPGLKGIADILKYTAETAAKHYAFDAIISGAVDCGDGASSDNFREAGESVGLVIETPLAGLTTVEILRRQEAAGVKAIIVAAERGVLPESLLGTETGNRFADILEKLNERGIPANQNDFQTLVTDSPLFPSPVKITATEIIRDKERSYLNITGFK